MNIYLDLCVYNRPFDDQSDPKILIETIGFLFILSMIQAGELQIFNSFVLEYENGNNPKIENSLIITDIMNESASYINYNSVIEYRAFELEQIGIKHFDALHLACAEHANADFFITCDDDLIKKANKIKELSVKVVSLLTFIVTEVFGNAEHRSLSS